MSSHAFLDKQTSLIASLKAVYTTTAVEKSEIHLAMSAVFPVVGFFLGASEHSKDSRTYAPTHYTYILSVFDSIDIDDADDCFKKQQDTFSLLEDIIATMGYHVVTDIEPIVSIATGEGSFITGWSTTIIFNS